MKIKCHWSNKNLKYITFHAYNRIHIKTTEITVYYNTVKWTKTNLLALGYYSGGFICISSLIFVLPGFGSLEK